MWISVPNSSTANHNVRYVPLFINSKFDIIEHKKDINKKLGNYSVITEHSCYRIECNHDFEWENPIILDKEKQSKV